MNIRPLLFVCLLGCCNMPVWAQEYSKCAYHYFSNKRVSTSECYDKDNRWGKAIALDKNGKVIYEKELRHVGGNSSVVFTYYPNGAVSSAKWHSAPDAGIQLYNSTTYFSVDGKIERVEENNYDDAPGRHLKQPPGEYTPQTNPPINPPHVEPCSAIYSTEFYFINHLPFSVTVTTNRKGNIADTAHIIIPKGDTVKGGNFIMTGNFIEISQYYTFNARPTKTHKYRSYNIAVYQIPGFRSIGRETRRYYYVITQK